MLSRAIRIRLCLMLLLSGPLLAGCVGSPPSQTVAGDLVVLAPASMTDVLPALVFRFTTAHSAAHVTLNFAPDSQHAAAQNGDVLIVEGPHALDAIGSSIGPPTTVAHNQLVLVLPPDDPTLLTNATALAKPGLRVALCAPTQPCGASAAAALAAANVILPAPIYVDDTRAARAMVEGGKADVALVYRTDASAAGSVLAAVEFPESSSAVTAYQAVVLNRSTNAETARAFISFLVSSGVQQVLANDDFAPA